MQQARFNLLVRHPNQTKGHFETHGVSGELIIATHA
jgi:hypothetical protein